jgi:hypothetical protein
VDTSPADADSADALLIPPPPCPLHDLCDASGVIQLLDGDDTSDDAIGGKDGQNGDRELADAQAPDATADVGGTVDAGPVDAGLCCNGCLPTIYPCGTVLLGAYPVTCTMGYCTAMCVFGVTSRGSVVACQ